MPRFSIIIPTRNRADIAPNAVHSVLAQTFGDFELIVSDNSDDGQREDLAAALAPRLLDPRARLVHTPEVMSMTRHWEWAVAQATGDYIGILTDRMLLRLNTLETLDAAIVFHKPDVIAHHTENLIEANARFDVKTRLSNVKSITTKRSDSIIASFAQSDFRQDVPRFLNSFASRAFLDHLRAEYGSVFTGTSPDYGFMMRVLDQRESYLFIEQPLLLKHSEDRSNGKSFTKQRLTERSHEFIKYMKTEQAEFLAHDPIKDDHTLIHNGLMREYEIARANQKSGRFIEFDRQAFHDANARHLRSIDPAAARDSAIRLEEYRVKNGLNLTSLTAKERRRAIRTGIKSVLGLKSKPRRAPEAAYTSMLDALAADLEAYRRACLQ